MDSDPWLRSAVKSCGRYTLTAQALHWIAAALMVIVLPLAWVMVNMPQTAHGRGLLFTLHEFVGLTIVALVACRLAWRARDRPEIWGIMTFGIGLAGYVAGWGFADGMDAAFGRDGD
jgi:Prokaryotic cytochrome b561